MKNKSTVKQFIVDPQYYKFAVNRCNGLLQWWGKFVINYSIEALIVSCYLQGISDCYELVQKQQDTQQTDYQI